MQAKHDGQQHELYEQLRQRRIPKFSAELLNMRRQQVLLARAGEYVKADKLKRKADLLETIEIEVQMIVCGKPLTPW